MNNQNNFNSHIGNLVSYKNYLLLCLLIISVTLPSCMIEELATEPHNDHTKVKGSGDMISEQLDLSYFNSISMNTAGLVEIESGSDQQVQVTVDDNIWEHIIIRIQDDVLIIEVGGTIGDIESQPFLEAIRQLRRESAKEDTLLVLVTYIMEPPNLKEQKTKPTQHAVRELHLD